MKNEFTDLPISPRASAPVVAQPRFPVWLMAVLLVLVTMALYWPVTRYDFVNLDDPIFVTANAHVQGGLTWEGVKWAFQLTQDQGDYWHPLAWLSLMLDVSLFGRDAGGFHLTNVALHAANSVLLLLLLRLLTGAFWRSVVVAALFALHPLRVESVAWVTERKDVLSTSSAFSPCSCYVRYAQESEVGGSEAVRSQRVEANMPASGLDADARRSILWLVPVFLACGLMSKAMLVTWPFVMLLLDYWPLQRLELGTLPPARSLSALVREKIPFFVLSGISCVITYLTEGAMRNRLPWWGPRRCFGWRTRLWPTLVIWARPSGL